MIDVLGQQVEKGKTHVAILFGAAHMADLDSRLRRTGTRGSRSSG